MEADQHSELRNTNKHKQTSQTDVYTTNLKNGDPVKLCVTYKTFVCSIRGRGGEFLWVCVCGGVYGGGGEKGVGLIRLECEGFSRVQNTSYSFNPTDHRRVSQFHQRRTVCCVYRT